MTYSKLLIGALVPGLASAAVTVRKTGKAPTGYEVDFTYFNSTAANVTIGGGFNVCLGCLATTIPRNRQIVTNLSQGLHRPVSHVTRWLSKLQPNDGVSSGRLLGY